MKLKMQNVTAFLGEIFSFFKEKVFDFEKFFSWGYLNASASTILRYWIVYVVIFALLIVVGLFIQFYFGRKTLPKFRKKFYKRLGDFLVYPPLVYLFLITVRRAGLEGLNKRILPVSLALIWLIWLGFLVYYRIAVVSKLQKMYLEQRRKEKYIRNGS
ncbi:MAG: hypothetical protein OEV37_02220 [Candidatus Berkelbacteria bacterium]|nr:hypothetical protein [Candidatus Berkelbacteria bacterium]